MGRFFKGAAAAIGIVTIGIMGLVGFYSYRPRLKSDN